MKSKTLLQIGVTLLLLAYLLRKIEISAIYDVLTNMNFYLLFLTIPFVLVMYLIKAQKWKILLNRIDVHIPFYEAFRIMLISTFYSALTPGRLGDVSRSFYLKEKKSKTIPTIIIDRIADAMCLLLLSLLFIILFFNEGELINLFGMMMLLFGFGVIVFMNEKIITALFKLFKRSSESKENYIGTMKTIAKDKKTLVSLLMWTFGYYAINLIVCWLLLKSINPEINGVLVFSFPIITLLANIPISISGIGIREMASVSIFSLFSESASYGFSFSMILYLVTVLLPGLIGSAYIITHKVIKNSDEMI